ncbi:cell wall-binding repeat-containing protein [Ornithinimicrobium avium]|uniref:NodB homology domain-containing protein n=1 Tax=Ornithinimicrobium avium TaxID=2283195 RepID=A0A345NP77_9MICO|nr:cell wall-binding repeat-containing protein [Ornithinimicrobium avium]AXH96835.1 hypothetical protein DV701_12550 [Ornithinimicrobium avium]
MGIGGAGGKSGTHLTRAGVWGALLALVATSFLGPAGAAEEQPDTVVSATHGATTDGTADATDIVPSGRTGAPIIRLAGADRYASAVAISRDRYADPAQASVVYLADGAEFSDALTAGTLSDGPVLLVRSHCRAVPTTVLHEIDRIDPQRVVALGGPAAVCDATLATASGGRSTDRIGGANRYETAALIAQRQFPSGSARVYLTRGEVSPDALGGGMLSDGPILLTSRDGASVPAATAAAVQAMGATRVVALGGPAAVSDAVLAEAADGRTTGRLAGRDRYRTAIAIAKHAYPSRTSRVYLARGDGQNFADAVASGMIADGPVLLTPGPCEPVRAATAAFLKERHPTRVVALGGEDALCTSSMRGASLDARPTVDCDVTRCVALTFDDGPGRYTGTLLDTLADYRVPATFFQVGQMVDAYGAYSRRAYLEGHEVANHTWDHTQLTLLTRAQQQWEVDVTDNELNQHGVPDTTLLRPPYGSFNSLTRQLGFPLVIWDVDPRDWDNSPSAATVRSRVMSAVRPGSIVLQHDIHPNSVDAVPLIISDLTAQGYTLVTVSELVPGLRPGDVVYRHGDVRSAGTASSPGDTITLPDGTVLGPFLDEAGVPGVAPSVPLLELLEQQR